LHLCLKEHLGTNQNANYFFSMTKTNGFVEWIHKKIIKMKLSGILINVSKQSINVEILKLVLLAVLKVIFYYLDLIKDLVIIFLYIKYFPVAHILILFDYPISKIAFKTIRGLLQLLAPLTPAISVYIQARLIYKRSKLLNVVSDCTQITDGDSFLELHRLQSKLDNESQAWMKLHSKLRLNENSTEHFIQAIFLIILILLKFSDTSTVTGFQDLFASKEVLFLTLSALWSNISIVLGNVNASIIKKNNFMPKLGKLLTALFSLISHFGRVSAVVLFFSPSLGLMNLLLHWKMGYNLVKINSQLLIYDANATDDFVFFENMWRPMQNISELTILSLETQCKIFLGLVILHFLAMFTIKVVFSMSFSVHQNMTEKIFHILIQVCFS